VSDLDTLTAVVEADHTDEIAAGVLYDALQELGGLSAEAARARVDQIRTRCRQAAELTRATHLLSPGTRSCGYLSGYVRRYVGGLARGEGVIVLVPGDAAPLHRLAGVHTWWTSAGPGTITVGASWLCAQWDMRRARVNSRERYRRLRQRHQQ
jgi:hypothetical protein